LLGKLPDFRWLATFWAEVVLPQQSEDLVALGRGGDEAVLCWGDAMGVDLDGEPFFRA
jgi:hypothetical protein